MLTAKPKPFAASLVCGFCVSKNHFRHEVRVCRLHGAHPEKAERCVVLRKRKDHETTGWEWWRLAGYAGAGGTSLTSLGRAAAKQPNVALAADRQTARSGPAAGVSAATPPAGTLAGDEQGGTGAQGQLCRAGALLGSFLPCTRQQSASTSVPVSSEALPCTAWARRLLPSRA